MNKDGSVLFKQTGDLFKQIRDTFGAVIGLMYKGPRMSAWSTMSAAQVKSRLNIYRKRAEAGEVSEAVARGLDVWIWASGLFGQPDAVDTESLVTIHSPGEGGEP